MEALTRRGETGEDRPAAAVLATSQVRMDDPISDELPSELRAFLYSCIDAVEQVEILALLGPADRAWTVKGVAAELQISDAAVRHHLESLTARGLLHITVGQDVSYRYEPRSSTLRGYGDALVAHYARSRVTILRLIASNHRRSMKRFADAFKLRDQE